MQFKYLSAALAVLASSSLAFGQLTIDTPAFSPVTGEELAITFSDHGVPGPLTFVLLNNDTGEQITLLTNVQPSPSETVFVFIPCVDRLIDWKLEIIPPSGNRAQSGVFNLVQGPGC